MKNTISSAIFAVLSTLLVTGGWPATPVDATETSVMSVSSTGKCDYISWIDPRIESARGRWFFSTPAARPFGMAKLSPHTVNRGQGGGGYNCTVHTALGFCHLHGWMTTGLEVMPTTGGDFSVTEAEAGWKSAFDAKTEIVKPGYHKLFLEKYATWVELTTTRRVGMHRYTYTKDGQADIVINLGGPAGPMKMKNGRITKVSNTQLEGYYDRTNGTWGGPAAVRIFFVIQFEKAFSNFTTYDDPKHNSTSAFVTYENVSAGDVVQMKAALSFTSIGSARANMAAELDHWDFDAVRDESFRIWNTWLGRIRVEGGTDAQRTKFYTDLWHVLLGRHVLSDVGGTYPDYTNGKELWRVRHEGWGWNAACRPIFEHGLVYFTTGFSKHLLAVRPSGTGDVTETHVVWSTKRSTPSVPSPLIVGDLLFMVSDQGFVSCLEAKTGRELWKERLRAGGYHWASPLYADGKIYFCGKKGIVSVIAAERKFRLLAENRFEASFIASPAIAADAIILRSLTHLYCVAEDYERTEVACDQGAGRDYAE